MSDEHKYPRGSGDPGFSEQHIFAALTGGNPSRDLPFETNGYAWRSPMCPENNVLWRIQTRERGVIRATDTGVNITSLTRREIEARLNAGSGGGESVDPDGQFPLEISVSVGQGQSYEFRMDANQSVEVYGMCIGARLLTSTNFGLVAPGSPVTLNNGGGAQPGASYEDALIGVDFQMVDSPLTQESIYYTQVLTVPLNTNSEIPVPERAISCQIVTSDTVAQWGAFIGDPAIAARQTQNIAFVSGAATVQIGNETHLQSDVAGADRRFRLRWQIKP